MRERPDLAEAITHGLPTRRFGHPLRVYEQVASTNDLGRAWAEAGAGEGAVVLALEQTAGRGRRGRRWLSPHGGIYLSVVLYPSLPRERWPLVGHALALGAAAAAESSTGIPVRLKWPNDLLIEDGKVGGVLVETWGQLAIAGIGLNVNVVAQAAIPGAASLCLDAGRWVPLVRAVLAALEQHYEMLHTDVPRILKSYRQRCLTLGRRVAVTGAVEISGVAEDLAEDGALLLRTGAGLRRVVAGEVSLREWVLTGM